MIKAIALDDEPPALSIIEVFCKQFKNIELTNTFTKPAEALKYVKKFPVDLVFLDIQMPSINGLDFCRELDAKTIVIFTTAYTEHAVEGFNLKAMDYLVKPYSYERFEQAVQRVVEYFDLLQGKNADDKDYIFIRADYSLLKIEFGNIIFIEGLDDYIKIHLSTGKTIVARITMKNILDKLPQSNFFRIHRSFIVNQKFVTAFRGKSLFIGEKELPVGASFEIDVEKRKKSLL
jgi:DNA-binding LytR/AlgR family response regulator